jgi:hypothetical protein
LHTVATIDDFYERLGYDPRPPLPRPVAPRVLPAFLRPLAGDVLAVPTDDEVTEIWVDGDEQIALHCEDPAGLWRLERIGISRGVTAEGMEQLRRTLPDFEHLVEAHVSSVPIPADWLRSLKNVHGLHLWGEFGGAGNVLTAEHLRELSALPKLKFLMIFRHGIKDADADAELLEGCRGLEYLIMKRTDLTTASQEQLAEALPDCVVRRD